MAGGPVPKYSIEYDLKDLTTEQFTILAIDAAEELGWTTTYIGKTGLAFFTNYNQSNKNADVTINIHQNIATIKSTSIEMLLLDWGRNKKYVTQLHKKIMLLKIDKDNEVLATKYEALKDKIDQTEGSVEELAPLHNNNGFTGFLSLLRPVEGYYITPLIVILNVLVFITMIATGVHILTPEGQSLINWGANYGPLTLSGEWYRLLTSTFLHIGVLHLLFNMYALIYIGILLEPYLGKWHFLAAYIGTGIIASAASLIWNTDVISAGASGAIFGMYGVFLALLITKHINNEARKSLLISIGFFVFYNLSNGMKPNSGIDNSAHIGGLISGFVLGLIYTPSLNKTDNKSIQKVSFIATGLLVIASIVFASFYAPNNVSDYNQKLTTFSQLEKTAIDALNNIENRPKTEQLEIIKHKGIESWEKAIDLFPQSEMEDMPTSISQQFQTFKRYSELRLESYKIIYKAIDEETNIYDDQISIYTQQIDSIISSLEQ